MDENKKDAIEESLLENAAGGVYVQERHCPTCRIKLYPVVDEAAGQIRYYCSRCGWAEFHNI